MIFFSIIIPVYNAEKYLPECIESILNQNFESYELIIVNDGSIDKSDLICKEFAEQSGKIKYYSKSNEGVSVARNVGIENAVGKYIMFVDADDVLYQSALTMLYEKLSKKSYDYLRYEFHTIDETGNKLYPNYEARKRKKYAGMTVDAAVCIEEIVRGEFFLWSGVFRRDIIKNEGLLFLPGCTYNEDTLFMMQFFAHSMTHGYLDCVLYGYRKTKYAVTANFSVKNYNDVVSVVNIIKSLTQTNIKRWNIAVKSTSEQLCLNLLNYDKKLFFSENSLAGYCKNKPYTIDWKIINIFGFKTYFRIKCIVVFMKKIIRRINS